MIGEDKIKAESVGGFLVLDVIFSRTLGGIYLNQSVFAASTEREAAIEQARMSRGEQIPYKRSWRERWETMLIEFGKEYSCFNLTKSKVVAYIRHDATIFDIYNSPKGLDFLGVETISKKHLNQHLLMHYINVETERYLLNG